MSYTGNPDDKFTQQRNTNGNVGISVETKQNLKTLAKVKETPVSKMLEPVIEDYIHRHRHVLESRRI